MYEMTLIILNVMVLIICLLLALLTHSKYVYNKSTYLLKIKHYEQFKDLVEEQFPDEIIIQTEIKKLNKKLGVEQSN